VWEFELHLLYKVCRKPEYIHITLILYSFFFNS
jgi:hypothetical protein